MRFKGLLNISVVAAGLRLLLCRFCAFPLPVWAIPVVGSGWLGAIQQLQGWGCSLCRWGGPTTRDGEGVYQGVAEKQGGVSRAGYRAIYPHPLSPFRDFKTGIGGGRGFVLMCSMGGSGKSGGGIFRHKCENN